MEKTIPTMTPGFSAALFLVSSLSSDLLETTARVSSSSSSSVGVGLSVVVVEVDDVVVVVGFVVVVVGLEVVLRI